MDLARRLILIRHEAGSWFEAKNPVSLSMPMLRLKQCAKAPPRALGIAARRTAFILAHSMRYPVL